eukprot:COSAG01_NODE_1395_length_10476_cov_11.562331_12_plen_55_part_00
MRNLAAGTHEFTITFAAEGASSSLRAEDESAGASPAPAPDARPSYRDRFIVRYY